ncbi:MAG: alpha-2-macroglobulin family protein [Paracoccaceae bacterium]
MAVAEDLIPPRRLILSQDTDLPGGDVASMFDTTIEACERACLSNDACTHFTFNTRNGSCFVKSGPGEGTFFQGAWSGQVAKAPAGAEDRAQTRRGELKFLQDWVISDAVQQAQGIANDHSVNGYTAEEHAQSARQAEAEGDFAEASRFAGAALNATDSAENWAEYARLLFEASRPDGQDQADYRDRAFRATINAYLRAGDGKALRHTILVLMGDVQEARGQGADKVAALRLAQSLQPRDDTAAALEDAIGKYGFRIEDNTVQADSARPQICVNFTENLVKTGVDYSTFVQLPSAGMTVTSDGWRQLCVGGVEHGQRYTLTFREGLPAADGQELAKSVQVSAYVRDRNPAAMFPGRGYVLPRSGSASIPVSAVNTTALDLTLFRVTDRNLLRSFQNDYFGTGIDDYSEGYFNDEIGTKLWSGSATVAQEINKDVTTRLPMDEALAGKGPGIYVLKATVPGVDPYVSPPAWQWFVVSDLGLTTMTGIDGLHVFVRGLGDAGAKAGVKVELVSIANEVLATETTDDQGYVRFEPGLTRGTGSAAPGLVVARTDDDLAFLSLTDPEFDLSDRGVEGREAAPPVDVFLTTDRGAYRAGETVHATALARDAGARGIDGLPLTAVLKRPDGVEYSRALAQDAGAGGHVYALPVGDTAPRGVWTMEIVADTDAAPLATKTFLVEDFLPERIDFSLTLPDQPIRLGDLPEVTVDAKYLFGAPGADLAIEGEVVLRAAKGLEAFPGYTFGREDEPFDTRVESFGDSRTDDSGQAILTLPLPEIEADPQRPLEMLAAVRVAEGSGRPVERRVSRILTPSAPMIGIKPEFDGVAGQGTEARFSLIAIGDGEKPVPMAVKWKLSRIQTDYQWYQSDGSWNWEPVITRIPVTDGEATTADAAIQIGARVDWGEYELAVEQADGKGSAQTTTTFWAGWYAPADTTATPDTLELSLDKPAYKPGETAHLRVVPRAAGTALITVLSNRLIAMKAVEVKEGENLIDLPVTDDWDAGVYVTASVLRPMDVAAGRNPARALGLAHASIDPGAKQLKATVEAPTEAAPRGPLEVAVKVDGVTAGETAYVTIAAVDQGILNLTAFTPPDPSGHYFGQRKLGVGIRDIYGRLIDGLSGAEGQVRSGGDASGPSLKAPPPTEELVAYFSGPVTVGADGYARATFALPSFNGTAKVMAVAWSKTGVGQANADVLVRDPVVVTASLPRFMAPGDTSRLLLEIVHATGPSGRMGLDVVGHGVTLGEAPSGVDLGDHAKARLSIPVTAGESGIQTIDVALTTPDSKQLVKTLTLPVQVNDPEVARISRLELKKGQTFTFDQAVFTGMVAGTGRATLAVGPIARLNAPGILSALDRYPYGCTEQMTSKALPLIYFDDMAQVMNLSRDEAIRTRVQQAIKEILTNQDSNGAFGLWGPGQGDFWLDAFVTDFLSRAKARGYEVPDAAFRQALDNLRNQVNYAPDFDAGTNGGGEALAYALMVLAREGAAAVGDLRYFADVKGDAFATPIAQAQLGAALASYGDQTRADGMFRRAAARVEALPPVEKAQVFRADYGTNYRDAAAVLTLAVESGSQAVDRERLTDRIATTRGLSTQESTWALLAANALIDRRGAEGITLNGAPADGPLVRVLDSTATEPVLVRNDGADTSVTVTAYGVPSEPEPAGGNGYAIKRSYFTMEGEPVDPKQVKVGTRLVTVLEVQTFGTGEARLMVADPLPAGFEIDNPNLISAGSLTTLGWLETETDVAHSEFRQDRFLTAIDRHGNDPFKLAYIVRAISPGTFHHPAASVEDMYRPDFRARTATETVTITE